MGSSDLELLVLLTTTKASLVLSSKHARAALCPYTFTIASDSIRPLERSGLRAAPAVVWSSNRLPTSFPLSARWSLAPHRAHGRRVDRPFPHNGTLASLERISRRLFRSAHSPPRTHLAPFPTANLSSRGLHRTHVAALLILNRTKTGFHSPWSFSVHT
jgi:hypothetical protein